MTPRLDVRRRPLDLQLSNLLLTVSVAIWISACSNPTSPGTEPINLGGVIRDASQQPVADVRVEIFGGPFAGRFTTSNSQGRFQFTDPPSVNEPVTLRISKPGYRSTLFEAGRGRALIVTLPAEPALLPSGEYSITFTAAAACTPLPPSLRSRTYSSMLDVWATTAGRTTAVLEGGDFFEGLRIISVVNRSSALDFFVYSYEAEARWGEELPIYERVSATEYLSLSGKATAPLSGTGTSLTAVFNGTMTYCARLTSPIGSGYPPQCSVPPLECGSDRHQLTLTRR